MDAIGNKSFMRNHAEGYQQPVLIKTYYAEEMEFKKTVAVVPRASLPKIATVNSIHVIYKVKVNDDETRK